MRCILLLVAVIALTGFSSYVSTWIEIPNAQESDFSGATRVIRGLGYDDAEVTHPKPTVAGFRSNGSPGLFLVLELDQSKAQLRLSFSEGATKFSPGARKKLDTLLAALRARFPNRELTVSEPK